MVTRTTHNYFFKYITIDYVELFWPLLASCRTGLMVWDNFQRDQELSNQCGRWSSKFLILTVQAAHKMIPFVNFQWDDWDMLMQYNREQQRPSPLGMQAYEKLNASFATFGIDVFTNHTGIHIPLSPCFTRDRILQYEYIINVRKVICNMRSRAFTCMYDCNSPGMNVDNLNKLKEYCSSRDSRNFFSCVYKFQGRAVLDWNPTADASCSLWNGVCWNTWRLAAGAGGVVLDLLMKFGVLKCIDDRSWQLDCNAKSHCLYSYGDHKSNKNCTSFVSTLSNWPLTFK